MSIIRWSPAIICTVVTTGLADYVPSVVKTESEPFVCTRVHIHTCPHPHTHIGVSGEDSRSLLRHLATLGS